MTPPTAAAPLLVLVAYYAPPAVGVAANRMRALATGLAHRGWRVVVVAPERVLYHTGGEATLPGVEIDRVANPEPSRWFRRLAGAAESATPLASGEVRVLEPAGTGRVGGWLRGRVRDLLYIPDAQMGWIGKAAARVRDRVAGAEGPTVVYSSSVPYSAHLAALRGVEGGGRALWVAEYRDPWTADEALMAARPAWRRAVDRRIDRRIVARADRVVVTTEATADRFATYFGRGRETIHVVRNGWDRAGAASPPGPDATFQLLFAGSLLDSSWADPVLSALAELRDGGRAIELRVLGQADPWRQAAGRVLGAVPGWLSLEGMVPPEAVPGRLASASALLLLRPGRAWRYIVSGKTYDYVGARRPIVAWTDDGTEMTALLERYGVTRRVGRGTPDAFAEVLTSLLEQHRAGWPERLRPEGDPADLARSAQIDHLDAVLRDAVRDRG